MFIEVLPSALVLADKSIAKWELRASCFVCAHVRRNDTVANSSSARFALGFAYGWALRLCQFRQMRWSALFLCSTVVLQPVWDITKSAPADLIMHLPSIRCPSAEFAMYKT